MIISFFQNHIMIILVLWFIIIACMFWKNAKSYKPSKRFIEQQMKAELKREENQNNKRSYSSASSRS